jgi:hypothetical protein
MAEVYQLAEDLLARMQAVTEEYGLLRREVAAMYRRRAMEL